jgi:hypothetical protein
VRVDFLPGASAGTLRFLVNEPSGRVIFYYPTLNIIADGQYCSANPVSHVISNTAVESLLNFIQLCLQIVPDPLDVCTLFY